MGQLARLRMQRAVAHLHELGPRALMEFLIETSILLDGSPTIQALLTKYQDLSPELLRAVGGDRFPPRPLRVVGQ